MTKTSTATARKSAKNVKLAPAEWLTTKNANVGDFLALGTAKAPTTELVEIVEIDRSHNVRFVFADGTSRNVGFAKKVWIAKPVAKPAAAKPVAKKTAAAKPVAADAKSWDGEGEHVCRICSTVKPAAAFGKMSYSVAAARTERSTECRACRTERRNG